MSIRYLAASADRAQQADDTEALDALQDLNLPRDPRLIGSIDPTGPAYDDDGGIIGWEITLADPYLEALVAAYNGIPTDQGSPTWASVLNLARTVEDLLEALVKARAQEIGCPTCHGRRVITVPGEGTYAVTACWDTYHQANRP